MWPFRRKVESRDLFQIGAIPAIPNTAAGVSVTADTSQRLSAVWACVRLLSDTVSCLPVHAFAQGSREPTEPAPVILRTPAAGTPLHDWLHQVMPSLLLCGNCWGVITQRAGAAFRPTQIELIEASRITV